MNNERAYIAFRRDLTDEQRHIEREAREQGEADARREMANEAYALWHRINEAYRGYFPGEMKTRLGKLRYRAWLRWRRRAGA